MRHLLALALVCYTLTDLKNEACKVLCQRDGYTTGYATKQGGCGCVDEKESLKNYVHRSMNLGPKPDVPFIPEAQSRSTQSPTIRLEYPDY